MNRSVISDSSVMTHEVGGEAREEDKEGWAAQQHKVCHLRDFPL